MFTESIKNIYTSSYDSWTSDGKYVNDGLEFQVDIGSAQNINSREYLRIANQTADGINKLNKANNIAVFDNLDVRKDFCEIDGQRYPRDGIITSYAENDYLDQYRDLKLNYKGYLGEKFINPFISYPDRKSKYRIQEIDLRHQVDHITPKKIQLFEEYGNNPLNARLFINLFSHKQSEMITDGNTITEISVRKRDNT